MLRNPGPFEPLSEVQPHEAFPPLPIALGRFKQLPQRTNEVWQGGFVKLPAWVDNRSPEGPPYRPVGALWIGLQTGLLHLALADEGAAATPELALQALLEFGLKESKHLGGRPGLIEVRDANLRDALAEKLAALNTSVRLIDALPAVDDALRSLEVTAGGGVRHPGMLEGAGVTIEQVKAFADAAAVFYRAAPWRTLSSDGTMERFNETELRSAAALLRVVPEDTDASSQMYVRVRTPMVSERFLIAWQRIRSDVRSSRSRPDVTSPSARGLRWRRGRYFVSPASQLSVTSSGALSLSPTMVLTRNFCPWAATSKLWG